LLEVEDRVVALFERIAAARGVRLPAREVVLGYPVVDPADTGQRLYALACRVPMGPAHRYAVLATPSAADRLVRSFDAASGTAQVQQPQCVILCEESADSNWGARKRI
ncbi:hypothetical protein OVV29_29885, partial [Klebsiella pneumoniae]|nr:hypothetical protein [Klebsiella pneumoniae]